MILVLCPDDQVLAELSFVLRTQGMAVRGFLHFEAALEGLESTHAMLLIHWTEPRAAAFVDAAKQRIPFVPSMYLSQRAGFTSESPRADCTLSPPMPVSQLLDHIRVISARRRGPRKGFVPANKRAVPAAPMEVVCV